MQGEGLRGGYQPEQEQGEIQREELRYSRFVEAQKEAADILETLLGLDEKMLPKAIKSRLTNAISVLEQAGQESFAQTVNVERQNEIHTSIQAQTGTEGHESLEGWRASFRKGNERASLNRELDLMQKSWEEAIGRLPDDSEMIRVTTDISSTSELQQYLASHRSTLAPEEIFFLQASVEIRRIKERLQNVRESEQAMS